MREFECDRLKQGLRSPKVGSAVVSKLFCTLER